MKTKDIKDYLHLYIGCKFKVDGVDGLFEICGVNQYEGVQNAIGVTTFPFERVKPILRPLSSMTEEEAREIWDSSMERTGYKFNHKDRLLASCNRIEVIAPVIPKLLSKGFDLFNLIPEGLAIEKQ